MSVTVHSPYVYSPGADVSATAAANVTERTFLKIAGARDADTSLVSVTTATAGSRACGVARSDAAAGEGVTLVRGASRIVWVKASGALVAGGEVEVAPGGLARALTSGPAAGFAFNDAADGDFAEINLYA